MKINANSIRAGYVLVYNERLYIVSKTPEHTKPGKGGAFVQVEMKDVRTGTKINERISSDVYVEKAHLDDKPFQYLYSEGSKLIFMDNESFEQVELEADFVGSKAKYLQEGMNVKIEMYENEPLTIKLPETVILLVDQAEPALKGQTAASSYKPAITENGIRVLVPPFVSSGDKIVVRTEDDSYVERAK